MKIHILLFLSLSAILSAEPLTELKLLSIGNSYTVNAHSLLRHIIEKHGKAKAVIGMAQIGGCTFERHWKEHLKSEEKPEHKPYKYNGKPMSLRDYLTAEKWDVVTIQSQSLQASQPETWQPYLDNILALVKELAPQAKIVLYRTWAYRADHGLFKKDDGFTAEKMNEKIGQAFAELSKKLGDAPIIPAGDAIWAAYQEEPVKLVVPDPDFDYKNPVYPNLPKQDGSLHNGYRWSKNKKKQDEWNLGFDASHLNVRGRYLVGCLFYAFLFQQDITDLTWAPKGISAEDAAFLRGIAQKFAKPQN